MFFSLLEMGNGCMFLFCGLLFSKYPVKKEKGKKERKDTCLVIFCCQKIKTYTSMTC